MVLPVKIIALLLIASSAMAQGPKPVNIGSNTTTGTIIFQNGAVWNAVDTSSIVNPPQGMKIYWAHAGVDSAYWSRIGNKWIKDQAIINSGGGSGDIIAKDTTVVFDGTFITFNVSPPPDSIAIAASATVDNANAFGYALSFANNKVTFTYPVAPIGTYLFHVLFTKPQILP